MLLLLVVCSCFLLYSMAFTSAEHVLCIPRSDSDGEHILVNVSSSGPKPLDLKIEATEGESPYVATSELDDSVFLLATDH